MDAFLKTCLIVCPLVFLAGFVDSVAGGGGIISLPAYLMAGLPAHLAAGTNKGVNGCGTLMATVKYFRSGKVRLRPAAAAALGALAGAALGAARRLVVGRGSPVRLHSRRRVVVRGGRDHGRYAGGRVPLHVGRADSRARLEEDAHRPPGEDRWPEGRDSLAFRPAALSGWTAAGICEVLRPRGGRSLA